MKFQKISSKMDLMNKGEFIEAGKNAAAGTLQFLTSKLQAVQEKARDATTEEEQADIIADIKQICLMLAESKAHLQDVYDMMQKADQLPECIDLDSFDMTPYMAKQGKYEGIADALSIILDL